MSDTPRTDDFLKDSKHDWTDFACFARALERELADTDALWRQEAKALAEAQTRIAELVTLSNGLHARCTEQDAALSNAVRTEAEKWQEKFSDALQNDLEHGVKWLNEVASGEFRQGYPALNRVLLELMEASE